MAILAGGQLSSMAGQPSTSFEPSNPFKISFFMWKVWKNKLPLDDFFRRLGYHMASKCWCCVEPKEETMLHVFYLSDAAKSVWKYFLGHAGISIEGINLHQAIVRCWTAEVVPRLKPEHGWTKVNTDGASRGNPGRSSIGYVLRNERGDIVYAYGKEIQEGSNSVAEARAILEALKFCIENDYVLIELSTDSMMLKHVISGEWKPPWNIGEIVDEIKGLMSMANVKVTHTMREGNSLADYIANYALDVGPLVCHNFEELDAQGRRLVNSDKLQCPYLRVRVARN